MAKTSIEWTDETWNPVRGCSRVSEGCRNCYAEHQAQRIVRFSRGRNVPQGQGAYDHLVRLTSQGPKWTGEIHELEEKLHEPMTWKRPRRVFVNSMSDLFHEKVSLRFIARVYAYMAYARQHTFQVLTKRAQRMLQVLTSDEFLEEYDLATTEAHEEACEVLGRRGEFNPHARTTTDIRAMDPTLPRPNIWLGVSVEDQAAADERIPLLLQTPARVRFLSVEPLLAQVDLRYLQPGDPPTEIDALAGTHGVLRPHGGTCARVDWVIVGGESGPGARLMKGEWARSLRDQCQAAGVPFFFKQWGGAAPEEAGRLLEGREWNEFPQEMQHVVEGSTL